MNEKVQRGLVPLKLCFSVQPILAQCPKIAILIQGYDDRLANRPFLVFDFPALRRSDLSVGVLESNKLKMVD